MFSQILTTECKDDGFRCVSYWFICPILLFFGIVGSSANLAIMTGREFKGSTFFFLRALSMSDLFYLVFAIGYFIEIMMVREGQDSFQTTYYLTYWDVIIGNTMIATSGFIIILLTIDRYRCICQPTLKRSSHPRLKAFMAFVISFILQLPRFMENNIIQKCVSVTLGNNGSSFGDICECSESGAAPLGECRYVDYFYKAACLGLN